MRIDADTLARMAIRLGRAYSQLWAKSIAKGQSWDWDCAKHAIDTSTAQRLPDLDEKRCRITYDHGSSHWMLTQERVQIDFWDRNAQGYIGHVTCQVDALGAPVISVRVESPRRLVDGQIWRVDKAVTSLSTERWQPLYSLPPLQVIWTALGADVIPDCPVTLYYRLASDGPTIDLAGVPVSPQQRESFAKFDAAFQRFKSAGGMRRWERVVISEVSNGRD